MKGFCWGPPLKKITSDHGDMVTSYAGAGRVQTIKYFLLQNRTENLNLTILGRFSINKTRKVL
jgi:hypothetical protein